MENEFEMGRGRDLASDIGECRQQEEYGNMKTKYRGFQIARAVGLVTLGAAAGSIGTLLFAPAAGRVTRRRIALQLRTLKRQTTRQLGQGIRQAQEWLVERVHNGHGRRVQHASARHA